MSTTETNEFSINDAIGRFTDAESALRRLMAAADELSSATQSVHEARVAMADTEQSAADRLAEARAAMAETQQSAIDRLAEARAGLEASERSLADGSSALYGLAAEIKDVARDLKDTAIAFRGLDPERLWTFLELSRRRLRQLFALAVAALAVAVVSVVVSVI